jgi:hypothetical protein
LGKQLIGTMALKENGMHIYHAKTIQATENNLSSSIYLSHQKWTKNGRDLK